MKGGKREGAGRPRKGADALDTKITIRLTPHEAKYLRADAALKRISVAEAARVAIGWYLGAVESG